MKSEHDVCSKYFKPFILDTIMEKLSFQKSYIEKIILIQFPKKNDGSVIEEEKWWDKEAYYIISIIS